MNAEFKMSEEDIKVAIKEYFVKRGLAEPTNVALKATANYDDRYGVTGGYTISGVVEISIIPEHLRKAIDYFV